MTSPIRSAEHANPSVDNCRFCDILFRNCPPGFWDRPLFESTNFVAIPSLGSLRKGWLLVVPKKHFLSTAALPPHLLQEMIKVKQALTEVLTESFGEIWAFEHGPAGGGRLAGCGVDHAHLHIVPLEIDLLQAARPFLPSCLELRP